MANATKKQLDYAQMISNKLGKQLPQFKDFDSINKFIQENRDDFYKVKNQETRDAIATNISIIQIASEIGLTPVKVGQKYYTLKEHDSVRIDPNKNCYWQNSKGYGLGQSSQGGSVIDFVSNFTGKTSREVVYDLAQRVNNYQSMEYQHSSSHGVEKVVKNAGELVLPPKASNMRRVYAYLINSRFIDSNIVQDFVDNRMLYQDVHGNCVFVSRDKENNPVFACKRGTNTERRFVGDVSNSDYSKGFYIDNKADNLIVTESVIDAMSVMNIIQSKGMDYHKYNYLPLAGASKFECVINQLKEHPAEKVFLALDNDDAGIKNMHNIEELIKTEIPDFDIENGIEECIPEYTKDWNEEIKYAFTHCVDKSTLDFFNKNQNDKALRDLQERLKNNDKKENTISHGMEFDEEIEI